jgi:hypothetical protein
MSGKPIRVPITNTVLGGDYTGQLLVGSQNKPVNVILDTGSSTFAVDGRSYNPGEDKKAEVTRIAQEVQYGSGAWVGSVVKTDVKVGNGAASAAMSGVSMAVAVQETAQMFGKSDGILGLAYTRLDDAYDLGKSSWPPAFGPNDFRAARKTFLEPYFTQLEQSGLVANKFAFYTKRSYVHHPDKGDPAADPLNSGFLILGGGEEATDLHDDTFSSVKVLSDDWYSVNLKAVIVGNTPPIHVLPPTRASNDPTNAIVDSGTNSLRLTKDLFQAVLNRFEAADLQELKHALRARYVPMSGLKLAQWPDLTFVLEGVTGDVSLTVKPDQYWQVNAPEKGYAMSPLLSTDGGQSILGLPLMNRYFTVHDRSANQGRGVLKFALAK